jgi:hypothetical protein
MKIHSKADLIGFTSEVDTINKKIEIERSKLITILLLANNDPSYINNWEEDIEKIKDRLFSLVKELLKLV